MNDPIVYGYPTEDGDYIISFNGHERIARVRRCLIFVRNQFGNWVQYVGPVTVYRKHVPLEHFPDP